MTETTAVSTITLYHGTSADSGNALVANGWGPNLWASGGNCGSSRYLHCTTGPEDALWFAEEKGESTLIEIREVALAALIVDPDDGTGDNVLDELAIAARTGLPAKLALKHPLAAVHFHLVTDLVPGESA
jgi:hypothetical protein